MTVLSTRQLAFSMSDVLDRLPNQNFTRTHLFPDPEWTAGGLLCWHLRSTGPLLPALSNVQSCRVAAVALLPGNAGVYNVTDGTFVSGFSSVEFELINSADSKWGVYGLFNDPFGRVLNHPVWAYTMIDESSQAWGYKPSDSAVLPFPQRMPCHTLCTPFGLQ